MVRPHCPIPPIALLDASAPRTRAQLVLGLAILLIFVVGFGLWSVLAPLAEAAIAPGVIKVEGNRRTIQHLEGGIVREILIHDGSKVQAGQVLMRLDDIQSNATVETERAQRWALLAQDARLNAEMARASKITFPADLLASTDPRAIDAVTRPTRAVRGAHCQSEQPTAGTSGHGSTSSRLSSLAPAASYRRPSVSWR